MSNRKIRKVRHFKPAPSFKELSQAGVLKQIKELWAKYGWGNQSNVLVPDVVLQAHDEERASEEHVHGEHCHHE